MEAQLKGHRDMADPQLFKAGCLPISSFKFLTDFLWLFYRPGCQYTGDIRSEDEVLGCPCELQQACSTTHLSMGLDLISKARSKNASSSSQSATQAHRTIRGLLPKAGKPRWQKLASGGDQSVLATLQSCTVPLSTLAGDGQWIPLEPIEASLLLLN